MEVFFVGCSENWPMLASRQSLKNLVWSYTGLSHDIPRRVFGSCLSVVLKPFLILRWSLCDMEDGRAVDFCIWLTWVCNPTLAVWSQALYLTILGFSFLICKVWASYNHGSVLAGFGKNVGPGLSHFLWGSCSKPTAFPRRSASGRRLWCSTQMIRVFFTFRRTTITN